MIKKIVLTGGPCGGKTSAINHIKEIYEEKGYIVLSINETATELMNMGIKPFGLSEISMDKFQEYIFYLQLFKEMLIDKYISDNKDKNILVLLDRCILDNNSYVSDEKFNELLNKFNVDRQSYINKYDLFIHLVSAAIDTNEYNVSNNSARIESKEEAKEKDNNIRNCYKDVNNYVIIDNSTNFEEKLKKVEQEISNLIQSK